MIRAWFVCGASSLWITPQAKIDDPKTPRPDDVEFDNEAYTNPKYAGTVWYIAEHLKDPTEPIIPLAALPPAKRQLGRSWPRQHQTTRPYTARLQKPVDLLAHVRSCCTNPCGHAAAISL